MSDLPTLIVDGSVPSYHDLYPQSDLTVRIDGPLPTVTEWEEYPAIDGPGWGCVDHPLRVGDRVELTTIEEPFATATVADIRHHWAELAYDVTVTDVEAL